MSSSSESSSSALLKGAKSGSFSEVSGALKSGADAKASDGDGNTSLHLVVKNSFRKADTFQIIEALIKAGADVNAVNKAGQLPIQVALNSGWQDNAALLFLRGAKFDADIHNNTKITCPDCNRVSAGWKANGYKWNGYTFANAEYNKAS